MTTPPQNIHFPNQTKLSQMQLPEQQSLLKTDHMIFLLCFNPKSNQIHTFFQNQKCIFAVPFFLWGGHILLLEDLRENQMALLRAEVANLHVRKKGLKCRI